MENPDICLNDPYQDISDEFGWTQSPSSGGQEPQDTQSHDVEEQEGTGIEEEVDWGGDEEHQEANDGDVTDEEEDEQGEQEPHAETKLEAAPDVPQEPQATNPIALEEDDDDCQIVSVDMGSSQPKSPPKGKGKAKGKDGKDGKAGKASSTVLKGKGIKGKDGKGGKGPIAKQYPASAPQIAKATVPKSKPKPQPPRLQPQPAPKVGPAKPPQPGASQASTTATPASPPVKAAPMPPQSFVSVDSLLTEQVRLQLLTEPGKRASMRRLLTQPKVSQLLRHLSSSRRLAFGSMPGVLCKLLRESQAFQLSESAKEDAPAAIQDVRVSLTEQGEGNPLVDKKSFDRLWSSLFPNRSASATNQPTTQAESAPAAPNGASTPQSSDVAARNQSKQRALQQIRDLDDKGVPDGPRPPSMPPPNYKADWRRFQPTAKRVLAPRRAGSASSLEDGTAQPSQNELHPPVTQVVAGPCRSPQGPRPPGVPHAFHAHSQPSGPTPPAGPPPGQGVGPRPHFHMASPGPRSPAPEPVDNEGRPFDLEHVVVNFANVGATYGSRVLKKDKQNSYLFDYEGVRRCVRHLTQKRKLRVIGVIFENFHGDENGREVHQVPPDISAMCESIELTPRLLGQRHKSADDEMTIKCAYRRNCRFLDNDNYQDWRNYLADEAVRTWLLHCQEFLQMKFYFDSGLGDFDILEGNIPAAWLAQGAAQGPSKRHCTRPWK
ncbi:unnamed protein product [Symbiodinium sp. CCMP2456]|nr:unnamed protein product [Symbiodinium sp. CCMP2456]